MAKFVIRKPAYIGGVFYAANSQIESDGPPAQDWEPLDDAAKQITREFRSNRPFRMPDGSAIGLHTDLKNYPAIADWVAGNPIYGGR